MRKVFYNVAGETFTSYTDALTCKNFLESIADETVDMTIALEEVDETDHEAAEEHRMKVERMCK